MKRLSEEIKDLLFSGTVIPAYPLALNEDLSHDEESQKMLTHYYIDSKVGGLAVGVHTTQFEIRDHNLYEPVLRMAIEEINKRKLDTPFIKVAGVCGPTEQAILETEIALELGYDIVLLSNGNLSDYSEEQLIERTKEIAKIMPVCGFYLQPSAGGRIFTSDFWEKYVDIDNVVAIKAAPFNRYQTLDVVKAVLKSDRRDDIALYTGNDDNIIADLLTTYTYEVDGVEYSKDFVGGLLGHWAVHTSKAVELFNEVKRVKENNDDFSELLSIGVKVTDANAAYFDTRNNFKGCIAGINEVLSRQGLLKGNWCLMSHEVLSPGQSEYIDEVYSAYPELTDDEFVKENLSVWRKLAQR